MSITSTTLRFSSPDFEGDFHRTIEGTLSGDELTHAKVDLARSARRAQGDDFVMAEQQLREQALAYTTVSTSTEV